MSGRSGLKRLLERAQRRSYDFAIFDQTIPITLAEESRDAIACYGEPRGVQDYIVTVNVEKQHMTYVHYIIYTRM